MEITSQNRRRQNRSMRTTADNDNMDDDTLQLGGRQSRHRQKKPLNFNQAMADFQTMFPHIEMSVIEAVLRSNDGVVQTTIDQLLVLAETTGEEEVTSGSGPQLPDYNDCQRSPFINEPPPAYTEFPDDQLINFDNDNQVPQNFTQQPRTDAPNLSTERRLFWNPPMIGKLPSDFLRLTTESDVVSANTTHSPNIDEFLTDRELEQFLEDQKLAMYLQNEEFIRQLRHDPDFVRSLEEDHTEFMRSHLSLNDTASSSDRSFGRDSNFSASATNHKGAKPRHPSVNQDDTAFRNKLKHMGHSTRKKFGKMAKKFGRKKPQKLGPHVASTTNLLEEDSDEEENNQTGLEGIEEFQFENDARTERDDMDEDATNNEKTGRRLPAVPPKTSKTGNEEPIVFYSEDNEFDFYD